MINKMLKPYDGFTHKKLQKKKKKNLYRKLGEPSFCSLFKISKGKEIGINYIVILFQRSRHSEVKISK